VLGGWGGDTIAVRAGPNLVLGDDGQIDYVRVERDGSVPGADTNASDIDVVESLSTTMHGGADTITSTSGNDIVIGGRGADTIDAGDGNNLVIGDSGRITAANATGPQIGGQPITLGLIETLTFSDGGADNLTTGIGNDIVFGGMAGDVIIASSGQNIVLGDDGQIDFVRLDRAAPGTLGADTDASDIDLIESLSTDANGGADTITVNGGNDILIGGRAGDSITAAAGTDLVIGDSGRITAADSASTLPQFPGLPVTIARLETSQHDDGGNDTIYGNAGNDVILGGFGADKLYGNGGAAITTPDADTILGDNAALFDVDLVTAQILRAAKVQTTDLVSSTGGNDTISGNEDDDVLLGGVGDDLIDGNSGRDLITGRSGNAGRPDIWRQPNPRYRAVAGTLLYATTGTAAGEPLLSGGAFDGPSADVPKWSNWQITVGDGLDGLYGHDYIAGGSENDTIFGQRGNDVIQGDGSIASRLTGPGVGASRDSAGNSYSMLRRRRRRRQRLHRRQRRQ
jgi:Ca2+-binding RTX toxin-like protein